MAMYDVAIIGGGLAGLALSISLARKGYSVTVFEKEQYPFHKVCGEYISRESEDFLLSLGLPLYDWQLPMINRLQVSSPRGRLIDQALPLGGFGVSRYTIDLALAEIAVAKGVILKENCKVADVHFNDEFFTVQAAGENIEAKTVAGSFGKRSNLDVRWKRSFIGRDRGMLSNYIGVKYHIQTDFPTDTIALHNFKGGYCGLVKIEADKYCLCYLTTADLLNRCNNSIPLMEERILCQNPHLRKLFAQSTWLYETPLTIAQVSFAKKNQIEEHVLMVGDAAGMITPLCGNGMSMALHGSKIAATVLDGFLQGALSRTAMEHAYIQQWQQQFAKRLAAGRFIQQFFGYNRLTDCFIQALRPFPGMVNYLVRQTHGMPF